MGWGLVFVLSLSFLRMRKWSDFTAFALGEWVGERKGKQRTNRHVGCIVVGDQSELEHLEKVRLWASRVVRKLSRPDA